MIGTKERKKKDKYYNYLILICSNNQKYLLV